MQSYSIGTDTERDIYNISDAVQELMTRDDFIELMNKSPLTLSELEDFVELLEEYGKSLYIEGEE